MFEKRSTILIHADPKGVRKKIQKGAVAGTSSGDASDGAWSAAADCSCPAGAGLFLFVSRQKEKKMK
ncbi:MAG: hypothetical protein JWP12_744 [Bacteroidetes bacterium]|nr:hypothetical protein [Bacteroidota bacterium]